MRDVGWALFWIMMAQSAGVGYLLYLAAVALRDRLENEAAGTAFLAFLLFLACAGFDGILVGVYTHNPHLFGVR